MKLCVVLLLISVQAISLAGCVTSARRQGAVENNAELHVEGGDMASIQFVSGRPTSGEGLSTSLRDPEFAMVQLRESAAAIAHARGSAFQAVGWTDDIECSDADCAELALRRATLVSEWLTTQAATKESMLRPKAGGRYFGDRYGLEESERSVARRVDIELIDKD